jgi:lysophospholipase L1-like esterase
MGVLCVCFQSKPQVQDPRIKDACFCSNPTKPLERDDKRWFAHHNNLLQDAIKAVSDGKELDLIMVGDSIMERWNGTRALGTITEPGMRRVYETKFSKEGGGRLEGVVFGSAGDASPNLLWHLHNGLLEQHLYPKVWLILIGSNDLFVNQCTDSFVLGGVLNVVKAMQEQRPEAQFIVHGILPRKDRRSPYLGQYWKRAQDINLQLRKFCNEQTNLHYMEASDLFVSKTGGGFSTAQQQIDRSLMADGVHPTIRGLEIWGDFIVDSITEILNEVSTSSLRLAAAE